MIHLRALIRTSIFIAAVMLAACQPAPTPTVRTKPATGLAPVNDIQMYYEIHGDGTPLILLHGGMGNAGYWENMGQMWASEPNYTAERLRSITVPTLILDGDNDEVIYTEHTKDMAGLIPRAELILIAGTGHFAPLEKREEFNRIVQEFLSM